MTFDRFLLKQPDGGQIVFRPRRAQVQATYVWKASFFIKLEKKPNDFDLDSLHNITLQFYKVSKKFHGIYSFLLWNKDWTLNSYNLNQVGSTRCTSHLEGRRDSLIFGRFETTIVFWDPRIPIWWTSCRFIVSLQISPAYESADIGAILHAVYGRSHLPNSDKRFCRTSVSRTRMPFAQNLWKNGWVHCSV